MTPLCTRLTRSLTSAAHTFHQFITSDRVTHIALKTLDFLRNFAIGFLLGTTAAFFSSRRPLPLSSSPLQQFFSQNYVIGILTGLCFAITQAMTSP